MSTTASEERASGLRVRTIVTLFASLFGIGISTYLTLEHYVSSVSLYCPATGHAINCAKVLTSNQSVLFGVPLAVLGLVYFVAMFVLSLPASWRSSSLTVARARLALSAIGMAFVFYPLYAELFVIHAICLWCTGVHILTFLIFVVVVTGWDEALA